MGRLVSFSEFADYYSELKGSGKDCSGTILDTNIMVSLTYEVKANYELVTDFLDTQIYQNEIQCYSNVVTAAEVINIYRRILLTENFADAIDENSTINLSKRSKSLIRTRYGYYKHLQETQGRDLIFSEGDLKNIRDTFSAVPHSGKPSWPMLVNKFLKDKLHDAYKTYEAMGIKYISPHTEEQKHLFTERLHFQDAISISTGSGLAIFDSMILNALRCSVFSFAITADADLAYATLVDKSIKDIVAPDSIVSSMKRYNFKVQ